MSVQMTANETRLFGFNWHPGSLRDNSPRNTAIIAECQLIVERCVSPTTTRIVARRPFANCPDPGTHRRRMVELDGQICPDCPRPSIQIAGPSIFSRPPKRCGYHQEHANCGLTTTSYFHDKSDAVYDDDQTLIQKGRVTDFTHPGDGKLRYGWARSPKEERIRVNAFIAAMKTAVVQAEQHLQAARDLASQRQNPAGLLKKAQNSLAEVRNMDGPENPALDGRHFNLRIRAGNAGKTMTKLEEATANR